MHIDIHGKRDRKLNTDIDLGVKALREVFTLDDQESLVKPLIKTFSRKVTKLFANMTLNGHPIVCNPNGELKGRWPSPIKGRRQVQTFTMT